MKTKLSTLALFMIITATIAQQEQDWAFLAKYKSENNIIKESKTFPDVVFMGNSITEGWYHQHPDFFESRNFLGRGIGGQTTPQMLIRFTPDVIDLRPKVVVILAGTNDIAGNTGFSSVKMITDNLAAMAQLAKAHGIKVVLSSVLPVSKYSWRPNVDAIPIISELNSWIKKYASTNNFVYLDYFSDMMNDEQGMKHEYSGDGVHPNLEGYKVMEPMVLNAIKEALH